MQPWAILEDKEGRFLCNAIQGKRKGYDFRKCDISLACKGPDPFQLSTPTSESNLQLNATPVIPLVERYSRLRPLAGGDGRA